jgi:hypothetical protein
MQPNTQTQTDWSLITMLVLLIGAIAVLMVGLAA